MLREQLARLPPRRLRPRRAQRGTAAGASRQNEVGGAWPGPRTNTRSVVLEGAFSGHRKGGRGGTPRGVVLEDAI